MRDTLDHIGEQFDEDSTKLRAPPRERPNSRYPPLCTVAIRSDVYLNTRRKRATGYVFATTKNTIRVIG